ncbi:MAG: P-type conjugative transfer protein TrbL [Rhodospirillaceae bacterium]
MDDLSVIDHFLDTFIRYIDSGFGLLNGEVAYLAATLIVIDIVLAAVFWAHDGQSDVFMRFVKKVLYIGVFAFILTNFALLADIIFRSFAGLGLTATSTGITSDELFHPGRFAGIGYKTAYPLLEHAGNSMGFAPTTWLRAAVLLFSWVMVILAFFVLAIQFFVAILEFKLTTLAGFVLVPFAFWNKTSFLAERVLGMVVTSGIKIMMLAVVAGISSGFFSDFTAAMGPEEPELHEIMALVLASLSLLGLSLYVNSLASGLASGAPQLGAGAAAGTIGGAAAATVLAGAAAYGVGRLAYGAGQKALTIATSLRSSTPAIAGGAGNAGGSTVKSAAATPDAARGMNASRIGSVMRTTTHGAAQAMRDGDRGSPGANPKLDEEK